MCRRFFPILLVIGGLSGCASWLGLLYPETGAIGATSLGALSHGTPLEPEGPHHRLYRREDRAVGTAQLTGLVRRAAARVACEYEGAVLSVGDMSGPNGGRIANHRSHRSGRDVDIAFFVTDLMGDPVESTPLSRFDRFGISARDDNAVLFDTARNWALVEALIEDETATVQWIFVSRGLKALLIEWGIDHAEHLETVARAVEILRQPGDAAPHDDHFHIRIYCPAPVEGAFCADTGPIWPWVSPDETADIGFSRDRLLALALEDL